jgi:hypothetical protein
MLCLLAFDVANLCFDVIKYCSVQKLVKKEMCSALNALKILPFRMAVNKAAAD